MYSMLSEFGFLCFFFFCFTSLTATSMFDNDISMFDLPEMKLVLSCGGCVTSVLDP